MAIIAIDRSSRERYVVIGSGYGMYRTVSPSVLGGSLIPREEDGSLEVIAVADTTGRVHFVKASHLQIIEVDGLSIKESLSMSDTVPTRKKAVPKDKKELTQCPVCHSEVGPDDYECKSCGLGLRFDL